MITRRQVIKWLVRGGFLSAVSYPVFVEPNWIQLKKLKISIQGLPTHFNSFKIGLLSDLHRGIYTSEKDISSALALIRKESPDILVFTGDFVYEDAEYIHSMAPMLSKVKSPMGRFAVLGNHDYWTDPKRIAETLNKNGIHVLINDAVEITRENDSIFLAGMDDAWSGAPNIKKVFKDIPKEKMTILLVHEPDYADTMRKQDGWIPLQLSGHSHGGQIVVPFFGAPVLPFMGRMYPNGLYKVNHSDRLVYTTKGIGNTFPARFNCRPEVTVLTLVNS